MKNIKSKKLWLIFFIIIVIFFIIAIVRFSSPEDDWICQNGKWVKHGNPSLNQPQELCYEKKIVVINDIEIEVETADNQEKRTKGLSDKKNLPDGQGMLFVFDKPGLYSFWMKDMKFPLDFVWINNNKVVAINENMNPENYQTPDSIMLNKEFDRVIELNADSIKKMNIKIGDTMSIL